MPETDVTVTARLTFATGGGIDRVDKNVDLIDGEISSFNPPGGEYEQGEIVPAEVTVENTGTTDHTFYVGYGVRDSAGNNYDNDGTTHEPVTLAPGETDTITVEWNSSEGPSDTYDAGAALWEREEDGELHGRLDERLVTDIVELVEINGTITNFNPPTGTYSVGDIVPAEVTVENTGTTDHTFYVGYGLRDSTGTIYDNDGTTHEPVTLAPGETDTVTVEWNSSEGPRDTYDAGTALWESEENGVLRGRIDERLVTDSMTLGRTVTYIQNFDSRVATSGVSTFGLPTDTRNTSSIDRTGEASSELYVASGPGVADAGGFTATGFGAKWEAPRGGIYRISADYTINHLRVNGSADDVLFSVAEARAGGKVMFRLSVIDITTGEEVKNGTVYLEDFVTPTRKEEAITESIGLVADIASLGLGDTILDVVGEGGKIIADISTTAYGLGISRAASEVFGSDVDHLTANSDAVSNLQIEAIEGHRYAIRAHMIGILATNAFTSAGSRASLDNRWTLNRFRIQHKGSGPGDAVAPSVSVTNRPGNPVPADNEAKIRYQITDDTADTSALEYSFRTKSATTISPWTEWKGVPADGTIEKAMPVKLGNHSVELRVRDPSGNIQRHTELISVAPAIEITSFNPPQGVYKEGESVSAEVTIVNRGTQQQTMFVGYGAIGPNNNHYDNNGSTGRPINIGPGESIDVTVEWTVEPDLLAGSYDLGTAVWLESSADNLQTRLDSEIKEDAISVGISEAHESIAFESASAGDLKPSDPWYLIGTAGTHEISTEHASQGTQSMHLASYRRDLQRTEVAIDVDLTDVETVVYDAYVESNNPNWGDIKLDVDGTTISNQLIQNDPPEDQWYYDVKADVSEYTGEHSVVFWVRGDGNDAYFDNVRFLRANGTRIDLREIPGAIGPNQPPTARVSLSSTTASIGETILVQADESSDPDGDSLSYDWTIASGPDDIASLPTGATGELQLESPGRYAIQVTVSDGQTTDTATQQVVVNDQPTVEVEAPDQPVTAGNDVQLAAQVTDEIGETTVRWQFPDGMRKEGLIVRRSFDPGTHDITVFVEDEHGAQVTESVTITVEAKEDTATEVPTTSTNRSPEDGGGDDLLDEAEEKAGDLITEAPGEPGPGFGFGKVVIAAIVIVILASRRRK